MASVAVSRPNVVSWPSRTAQHRPATIPGRSARPCFLNGRARHRAVRTEHAAVALLGSQDHPTALLAVVEELARVGRHGFGRLVGVRFGIFLIPLSGCASGAYACWL